MDRWLNLVITVAILVLGAGAAWGVMSSRVSASELRIERIEVRQDLGERRATATEWMLFRICERVGAQPCVQPGGQP